MSHPWEPAGVGQEQFQLAVTPAIEKDSSAMKGHDSTSLDK